MAMMKILLYGQDEALLYSRGLILKSRGFDVDATCTGSYLEQALAAWGNQPAGVYLLLLCHTLPHEERHRVNALARQYHPRVGTLQIELSTQMGATAFFPDTVDASRGPETLIAAVEHRASRMAALQA